MLLRACLTSPRLRTLGVSRLAAPKRALHASRPAQQEAKVLKERSNRHVLDSYTVSEWTEIPKGGMHGTDPSKATWSIWYNHAVVPLYAVIGVASFVCSFFMYRYFSGHTEIAWSKSMRATYDHQGMSDHRADTHTNRLMYPGMMRMNKMNIQIFPFNFVPMQEIRKRHEVYGMERESEE